MPDKYQDQDELIPEDPKERAAEDEYLSKLANSVLKKKEFPYKDRVKGSERRPVVPGETNRPGPVPPAPSQPAPAREETQSGSSVGRGVLGTDGTFPVGTILYFEDGAIGFFKDHRHDKDYEIVYQMRPDGRIKPQGVPLHEYEVKAIGQLPPEFVLRLQRRMRWQRDEVVFHLDHFDYCQLVPYIVDTASDTQTGSSTTVPKMPAPAAGAAQEEKKLVRGRRVRINFGNQEWHAVYWGQDELGPVVAHNTHQHWALMHLDLNRFRDSLVIGDAVDEETYAQIAEDIASAE
ncbi:hypothetical protein KQI84_16080 [bacterium]|nr:hypothetical protein [bacterium]